MDSQVDIQRASSDFWFAMVDRKVATDSTLSPIDKAVFCVLCSHVNYQSHDCWLKVETIAKEAGCSERSVQRSLTALEERGIIERAKRFSDGRQISSSYMIIGHKAKCYTDEGCHTDTPPRHTDTGGVTESQTYNENPINDIKDSFTRGADLPTCEEAPKDSKPESRTESFSPEDAPEIMRSTAEYLLLKTRRKTLTENEISALRELSASQYPSRVQKEIDRACERFNRNGNDLGTLTFCYIAGALRNQPSRKKKSRKKSEPDGMSLTQAEIDATRTEQTEEELYKSLAELEAEIKAEGC